MTSIGDTGITNNGEKIIVRAIAVWSPYEHVIVYFKNRVNHYMGVRSCRMVLTEKQLDFRIDSYYMRSGTMDFISNPEFVRSDK